MTDRWFVVRGDAEEGPISPNELRRLAVVGSLQRDHKVRREHEGEAVRAGDLQELFPEWFVLPLAKKQGPLTSFVLKVLIRGKRIDEDDLLRRADKECDWRIAADFSGVTEVFSPASATFVEHSEPNELTDDSTWYWLKVTERSGPFSTHDLKTFIQHFAFEMDDVVYHPGHCRWMKLADASLFDEQALLNSFSDCQAMQSAERETKELEATGPILKPAACLAAHKAGVSCLAFSRDGSLLLSGSFDRTARLWDVDSREQVGCFLGHSDTISSLTLSPDARKVATSSWDGTVRVWECETGNLLQCLAGHQKPVNGVAFLPDGMTVVSGGDDGTIRLWDVDTGRGKMVIEAQGPVKYMALVEATGTHLPTTSPHKYLLLWDLETGKMGFGQSARNAAGIGAVAVTPDGQHVVAGGTVDVISPILAPELTSPDDETEEDSEFGYQQKWGRIYVWDLSDDKPFPQDPRTWKGHCDTVWDVAVSPRPYPNLLKNKGKHLVASASSDRTVKLWEAISERLAGTLRGHQEAVYAVVFSPTGTLIATGSEDGSLMLWDISEILPRSES